MSLIYRSGYYIWRGDNGLPMRAGFTYDSNRKYWHSRDAALASNLSAYADEECSAELAKIERLAQMCQAVDTSWMPTTPGLMPFQRAGVEAMTKLYELGKSGVILGDAMGLGKTVQALALANQLGVSKIAVVCPASLIGMWESTVRLWAPTVEPVIISYNKLAKLPNENWPLVIFDESHSLKTPTTARTKAAYQVKGKFKLLMSGTPLLNRPIELFTSLNLLDKANWPDQWQYAMRYCGAYQRWVGKRKIWDFRGASNLDELKARLRAGYLIRRLKEDVLTDLPAKTRQVIEFPTVGKKFSETDFTYSVLNATTPEEFTRAAESLHAYIGNAGHISTFRKETGLAKIVPAIEFLTHAIESSGKVVAFAHHKEVMSALAEGLAEYEPAVVAGDTPTEKRSDEVARFQTDPSCRLFLGSIKAAGVGLTLTSASHVVMVEQDWTPGWMQQAEDRCHRIGQKDNVLVQYLTLAGSLDSHLANMLSSKTDVFNQLFG